MKVVLVTSFPAFPTTAGNRSRIRQLAQAIRQLGHDLVFVLLESKWEEVDGAAHEAAFGAGNFIHIRKKYWLCKWAQELAIGAAKRILQRFGVDAAYYSGLDRFRDRHFTAELRRLDVRPDAVLVEYVLDSWAFDAFPDPVRRILDAHDAFADRHRAYIAQGIGNYWVSLRPEAENAGLRRADAVLAIQREEALRFRGQLATPGHAGNPEVVVVSHFLELGGEMKYDVDGSAVFLGSDNPSNQHAMRVFLEHILPTVVRKLPNFDLKVVGSICGHVPDMPNVTRLGWVDDVNTLFQQAPLSINPMLAGTGISIKLLDSMSAGVPTVSTVTGARGLPDTLRSGVFVVPDSDAEGFAAATVRFATDAGLRRRTGQAARESAALWNASQLAALGRCLTPGR